MSGSTAVIDRRGRGSAALVAVVLSTLLAGLLRVSPPAPLPAMHAAGAAPIVLPSAPAFTPLPVPLPGAVPHDHHQSSPTAAAAQAGFVPPSPRADMPYRFLGITTTDGGRSIVLFGRGRAVHLREPAPLDDEYVVEGIFEDYLVVRHVPSGAGRFLMLTQRQQESVSAPDPELSPRD